MRALDRARLVLAGTKAADCALPMSDYHEPQEELDDHVRDMHRALSSLKEEVEAVDWYTQRAFRCADPVLRRVIEHNRDEEIEHAVMTLEWLRRTVPVWDEMLRTYLFSSGDIVGVEKAAGGAGGASKLPGASPRADAAQPGHGLGIGSLRERNG